MRPQSLYEVLSGQRLSSILTFEPWGDELSDAREQLSLFGALVLQFESHALLIGSPLRYLRTQEGTRYGLADGRSVSLGFRALLCESEQAKALVQLRLGLPGADELRGWSSQPLPVVGSVLRGAPLLGLSSDKRFATIMLDFEGGARYRLEYRPDLDGAIEFTPSDMRSAPEFVEVLRPRGPFAWLHPARIAGFVLDDQRWRSTERWPIEVRRRLRDADSQGPEVMLLLRRAWLAFFRQNPDMCRRLLALSVPVRVVGLPAGFVEVVRAELRAEAAMAPLALAADASAAPASARPPAD